MSDQTEDSSYGLVEENTSASNNWSILWSMLFVLCTICTIVIVILLGVTYGEVKDMRHDIDDIANDIDEITKDLATLQSLVENEVIPGLSGLQSNMMLILEKLDMLSP